MEKATECFQTHSIRYWIKTIELAQKAYRRSFVRCWSEFCKLLNWEDPWIAGACRKEDARASKFFWKYFWDITRCFRWCQCCAPEEHLPHLFQHRSQREKLFCKRFLLPLIAREQLLWKEQRDGSEAGGWWLAVADLTGHAVVLIEVRSSIGNCQSTDCPRP